MLCDMGENVTQIRFGIDTVEFGRADQAINCGSTVAG
jgi:hypothetical protein